LHYGFYPPWASQRRHVIGARLAASLVVDNVKRDALALLEPKGIRDVAPVDENICAAVIRSDETEASIFLPTNTDTRGHIRHSLSVCRARPDAAKGQHPAGLPGGGHRKMAEVSSGDGDVTQTNSKLSARKRDER
jgi:hypothetical protein